MEGWTWFYATSEVTTIQQMGDWLCGSDSASRKEDRCAVHHHHDYVLDQVGRGVACEGLYRCENNKVYFWNMLTKFSCLKILMSHHGTHFLNKTISVLTKEFHVYHKKGTPYYPRANGMVEELNKILESALTKVCNSQWNDWDVHVLAVLWAYRTTCKNLTGKTPFKLVYGVEAMMPMEYIVPSMRIAALLGMVYRGSLEERLAQLAKLEEDWFLVGFHQQVQKERKKAWHN